MIPTLDIGVLFQNPMSLLQAFTAAGLYCLIIWFIKRILRKIKFSESAKRIASYLKLFAFFVMVMSWAYLVVTSSSDETTFINSWLISVVATALTISVIYILNFIIRKDEVNAVNQPINSVAHQTIGKP